MLGRLCPDGGFASIKLHAGLAAVDEGDSAELEGGLKCIKCGLVRLRMASLELIERDFRDAGSLGKLRLRHLQHASGGDYVLRDQLHFFPLTKRGFV